MRFVEQLLKSVVVLVGFLFFVLFMKASVKSTQGHGLLGFLSEGHRNAIFWAQTLQYRIRKYTISSLFQDQIQLCVDPKMWTGTRTKRATKIRQGQDYGCRETCMICYSLVVIYTLIFLYFISELESLSCISYVSGVFLVTVLT